MGRLGVEDHGLGHDHGPVSRRRGAPAEVEVVAEDRELSIEPLDLLEYPAADQHAGGVDREHRADLVVLALVVLAALEAGLAPSGAGDRDTELEEPLQRGPLPQLGAEHVGVGVLLGGGQQRLERSGVGVGVVVEDPDPLRVADLLEPEADGVRERGGAGHPQDAAEGLLEEGGAGVLAAGVDGDHPVDRGVLAAEAVDDGREPPPAVMADEQPSDAPREAAGDGAGNRRMHDPRP